MTTRLYFHWQTAAPVNPTYSGSWNDTTSNASRADMGTTILSGSTLTTSNGAADGDDTDRNVLWRQFVSRYPLTTGSVITGAQAIKVQIQACLFSLGNNIYVAAGLRIINSDGTVQKTMLDVTRDNTLLANSVSGVTNRQCAFTSAAGNYGPSPSGDYLVLEIGVGGDPSSLSDHNAKFRFGVDGASDLPEDDTDTSATKNPWLELADTLTFTPPSTPSLPGFNRRTRFFSRK